MELETTAPGRWRTIQIPAVTGHVPSSHDEFEGCHLNCFFAWCTGSLCGPCRPVLLHLCWFALRKLQPFYLFCVSLLEVTLFFSRETKNFLRIRVVSFMGNCVTGVGYNTLVTTFNKYCNKYCIQVLTSNNSPATVKFTTLLGHLTFTWHLTFL